MPRHFHVMQLTGPHYAHKNCQSHQIIWQTSKYKFEFKANACCLKVLPLFIFCGSSGKKVLQYWSRSEMIFCTRKLCSDSFSKVEIKIKFELQKAFQKVINNSWVGCFIFQTIASLQRDQMVRLDYFSKWVIPGLFFFIFVFSKQLTVRK